MSAEKLRQAFEAHGEGIFPRTTRIWRVPVPRVKIPATWHRYSKAGLRETIVAILEDPNGLRTIAEASPALLIPAVNTTRDEPAIFRSSQRNADVPLLDLALATSAAPTYFPEHAIGGENFVDGGLIANAPDLLAYADAIQTGRALESVHMRSLGTIEEIAGRTIRGPSGTGYATGAKRLFELTLDAQQRLAIEQIKGLVGERYVRIDAVASAAQMQDLGLDRIDRQSRKTLSALATGTIRDRLKGG